MLLAPLALLGLALVTLAFALGYHALVNRIEAPYQPEATDLDTWADVDASLYPEHAPMVKAAALGLCSAAWAMPEALAKVLGLAEPETYVSDVTAMLTEWELALQRCAA